MVFDSVELRGSGFAGATVLLELFLPVSTSNSSVVHFDGDFAFCLYSLEWCGTCSSCHPQGWWCENDEVVPSLLVVLGAADFLLLRVRDYYFRHLGSMAALRSDCLVGYFAVDWRIVVWRYSGRAWLGGMRYGRVRRAGTGVRTGNSRCAWYGPFERVQRGAV